MFLIFSIFLILFLIWFIIDVNDRIWKALLGYARCLVWNSAAKIQHIFGLRNTFERKFVYVSRLKYSKIRHTKGAVLTAFCYSVYVLKISFTDQAEKGYRYHQ